jgi:hypothetical protein
VSASLDSFFHTKSAHKVVIKVASKILKRKERNCAFENLSLRCSATKKACGLADLRSSEQCVQLCLLDAVPRNAQLSDFDWFRQKHKMCACASSKAT